MSAYVSKMSFLVGGFVGDIGFLPSKARADRAHVHHTRALAPRRRPNCTRHARARAPRPRTCTAPAHVYHARALLATAPPRTLTTSEPARGCRMRTRARVWYKYLFSPRAAFFLNLALIAGVYNDGGTR